MQMLPRALVQMSGAIAIAIAAAGTGRAAEIAIVDVPQGMILETQLARTSAGLAPRGTPTAFVVTHDLRIGKYVVVPAGSRGVGHLITAARVPGSTTAMHVACDYVVASDGTRIPVAGSLPYLTTSASRPVVMYDAVSDVSNTSAVPRPTLTDAPVARP